MGEVRQLRANWDLVNLGTVVMQFKELKGRYPKSMEEMILAKDELGLPMSLTLLIQPVDPWGGDYQYSIVNGLPRFASLGRDGRPGGEDEEMDLTWPWSP